MTEVVEHVYREPPESVQRNLRPLLEAGLPVANRRILDAGCGTGAYSYGLAMAGAARVVGIDAVAANITAAWALHPHPAVEFRQGDIQSCDPGERFDMIFARGVLYYCTDPGAVMRHWGRFLEPGGVLLATFHQRTPRTRLVNGIKRLLARAPLAWRPALRDGLAQLYHRSPWADREGEDDWPTVRGKMSTLFFPVRYLLTPEEAEQLVAVSGYDVVRMISGQGHRRLGGDFALWAVRGV